MAFLKISAAVLAAASMACAGPGSQPAPLQPAATPEAAAKPAPPAPGSYEAEVLEVQQEREAAAKTGPGWVAIAGLFWLAKPGMTFGSGPLNGIVLPASSPEQAGTFEV